ncbi:MAG TPA: MMPL family transporter, partial [Trueperaceae bacterium]
WAIGATLLLVVLGVPAYQMQLGDPEAKGLSRDTDAHQVQLALEDLNLAGFLNSYDVLIDFEGRDGGFFDARSVREIAEFTRAVGELDHVDEVMSPTTTPGVPGLFLYQYYASRETALASSLAELVRTTVSKDGHSALVKVYPTEGLTPAEGRQLAGDLRDLLARSDLHGLVGGDNVGDSEWTDVLYQKFPLAVGLVYLVTLVLLGTAFKSLLIPIKSILLNTLTVAASFGVITLVFQNGVGASLLGVSGGLGFVDTSVPIFIFAIVFGLSMDYEVFLVARIYEAHQRGMSDKEAVSEALGSTGGVISSAAAIMVVLFSLFIFSQVMLIKMLGVGLSLAVLLDATLVRLALVPAVMSLAGRWNWWMPRPAKRLVERLDLGHESGEAKGLRTE